MESSVLPSQSPFIRMVECFVTEWLQSDQQHRCSLQVLAGEQRHPVQQSGKSRSHTRCAVVSTNHAQKRVEVYQSGQTFWMDGVLAIKGGYVDHFWSTNEELLTDFRRPHQGLSCHAKTRAPTSRGGFVWHSLVWQVAWSCGVSEDWFDFWLHPLVAVRGLGWITESLWAPLFKCTTEVLFRGASEIISVKHLSQNKIWETLKIRQFVLCSALLIWPAYVTWPTMLTSGSLQHTGV